MDMYSDIKILLGWQGLGVCVPLHRPPSVRHCEYSACVLHVYNSGDKYAFLTCQLIRVSRSTQVQVQIQTYSNPKSSFVRDTGKTGNAITGIEAGILQGKYMCAKTKEAQKQCNAAQHVRVYSNLLLFTTGK